MSYGAPMIAGNTNIPIAAQSGGSSIPISGGGDYGNSMIAGNATIPIVAQSGGSEEDPIMFEEDSPMVGGDDLSPDEQRVFDSYHLDSKIVDDVLPTAAKKREFMLSMNACGEGSGADIILDAKCESVRKVVKKILEKKLAQEVIQTDASLTSEEKDKFKSEKIIPEKYKSKKVCIDFDDVGTLLKMEEGVPKKDNSLSEKKGFFGKFFGKKNATSSEKGTREILTTPLVPGPLQPSFLEKTKKYVTEIFGDSVEKVIEKSQKDYKRIKSYIQKSFESYDQTTQTLKEKDSAEVDTFINEEIKKYNHENFGEEKILVPSFDDYKMSIPYDKKSKDKKYVNDVSKKFEDILLMYYIIFAKQYRTYIETQKMPYLESHVSASEYTMLSDALKKILDNHPVIEYKNIYTKEYLLEMVNNLQNSIKVSDISFQDEPPNLQTFKELRKIVDDINTISSFDTKDPKVDFKLNGDDNNILGIQMISENLNKIYNDYEKRIESKNITITRKEENIKKLSDELIPYYKGTINYAKDVLLTIATTDEQKNIINESFRIDNLNSFDDYKRKMERFPKRGEDINRIFPPHIRSQPVVPEVAPVAPVVPEVAPVAPVVPEVAPVVPEVAPVVPEVAPVVPEVTETPPVVAQNTATVPNPISQPPPQITPILPESSTSAQSQYSKKALESGEKNSRVTYPPRLLPKPTGPKPGTTRGGTRKRRAIKHTKKHNAKQVSTRSKKRAAKRHTKTQKRKHRT